MIRNNANKWALILFFILLMGSAACSEVELNGELAQPDQTMLHALEPADEATINGTDSIVLDAERKVNLPVIISDEDGQPTATETPSDPAYTPEATVTPSATVDPDASATPSATPSNTPVSGTSTVTNTPGASPTSTPTATGTVTPATFTPTATNTVQATVTNTPTPTATLEYTETPTATATTSSLHYADCAFRTGNNAIVAVESDIAISGDLVLASGDEMAVFTPDGTICAGVELWDGGNISIAAWGDDSFTVEVDGLRHGETMMFRIWDVSAGVEYQVTSTSYSVGNGVYSVNSIHAMSAMTVNNP